MKYTLNYASKMQNLTEQDIEETIFDADFELIDYLEERFDRDDEKVVYVFFSESSSERPSACISREPDDIIKYCAYGVFDALFVYECTSYSDALQYLNIYFESSSVYND